MDMSEPTHAVLEAALPMTPVSWGVLAASVVITVVWLAYLYR